MNRICLSTAYLAPVSYYAWLLKADHICIEQHEHYTKQTYRNRANIATANGVMPLTIPVEHNGGEKTPIRDLRISDHGNWRHLHWQALTAAYDKSPFFEYYADDFRVFYDSRPSEFLFDYNMKLQEMICEMINMTPHLSLTTHYEAEGDFTDLRSVISPKTREHSALYTALSVPSEQTETCRYYQVFGLRHGFQPDLSIVDLLFNMGPESLLVLNNCTKFCTT